jgi:transposase
VSDLRERALALHKAGLTDREIGEYLGVDKSTVWKWRHPDQRKEFDRRDREKRRESRREWNRAHMHAPCPLCGGPMSRNKAAGDRCAKCREIAEHARRSCIQDMWLDGHTMSEIADALGTTLESLGVTMVRMRKQGWDLPYRYRMENGKRVAA